MLSGRNSSRRRSKITGKAWDWEMMILVSLSPFFTASSCHFLRIDTDDLLSLGIWCKVAEVLLDSIVKHEIRDVLFVLEA